MKQDTNNTQFQPSAITYPVKFEVDATDADGRPIPSNADLKVQFFFKSFKCYQRRRLVDSDIVNLLFCITDRRHWTWKRSCACAALRRQDYALFWDYSPEGYLLCQCFLPRPPHPAISFRAHPHRQAKVFYNPKYKILFIWWFWSYFAQCSLKFELIRISDLFLISCFFICFSFFFYSSSKEELIKLPPLPKTRVIQFDVPARAHDGSAGKEKKKKYKRGKKRMKEGKGKKWKREKKERGRQRERNAEEWTKEDW